MLESATTITVTISSILLFFYWFRYTCRLILIGFRKVQQRLQCGATDFDGLKEMLDLDYAVLAHLMHHAEYIAKRKGGQ